MLSVPSRQRALVTGASSGIGEAIARELADRGYDLVLVARRTERLHALGAQLTDHASVETLTADLSTQDGINTVANRLHRGDIDVLVSNAGISGYVPLVETDEQALQRNWLLNTTAPLALTRAAVPAMIRNNRGGVILVASCLAFSGGSGRAGRPSPNRTLYASAKAALEVFGRILAEELDHTGVTVTVLCPPRTSTEWNGSAYRGDDVMTAQDVASAALTAFNQGEVICLPGLQDTVTWDAFLAAEQAVLDGNARPELPPRYR